MFMKKQNWHNNDNNNNHNNINNVYPQQGTLRSFGVGSAAFGNHS